MARRNCNRSLILAYLDLAALAIGVAEQMRDIGLAVMGALGGGQIDRVLGLDLPARYRIANPKSQFL